jgi:hypothetical protein
LPRTVHRGARARYSSSVAVLTHLIPANLAARARKNGLKAGAHGLYCMPLLPNYFISHQWMRELKRRGVRSFVAIDFRVRSDEKIAIGHYNHEKVTTTVGKAIADMMRAKDPRGWELILPRSVAATEIVNVRPVARVVGWRYFPGAHARKPCACGYCLKGDYNSRSIRQRLELSDERRGKPQLWAALDEFAARENVPRLEETIRELMHKRDRATRTRLKLLLGDARPLVRHLAAAILTDGQ